MQHWKIMTSKNSVIQIYLFLINLIFYNEAKSYHAVVIIHGVLTGSESMELISNRIKEVGEMKWSKMVVYYKHHNTIVSLFKYD